MKFLVKIKSFVFLISILASMQSWSSIQLTSDLRYTQQLKHIGCCDSPASTPSIAFSDWEQSAISPEEFSADYFSAAGDRVAQFGFGFDVMTPTILDMSAQINTGIYQTVNFRLWSVDPTTSVSTNVKTQSFTNLDPYNYAGLDETYLLNQVLAPGSYGLTWYIYGDKHSGSQVKNLQGTFETVELPEPSSIILLVFGAATLLLSRFRAGAFNKQ